MPLQEQTAWEKPKVLRTNRPQDPQSRVENPPRQTTSQGQTQKPVPVKYADDAEDDVFTERRMPVITKRYNTHPTVQQTRVTEEVAQIRVTPMRFFLIALGVILISFTLAIAIIAYVLPAIGKWNDDRTYGYPRTTHARAIVGHGSTAKPYSNFTGENIGGYMYVFEVEEGSTTTSTAHVYYVIQLTGAGNDLIPITSISFSDMNGDGKSDMLVTLENGSTFVFYNTGTSFSTQNPVK